MDLIEIIITPVVIIIIFWFENFMFQRYKKKTKKDEIIFEINKKPC